MEIRKHVAELLDVPPAQIGDEDNLLDHGMDSIRIMSIVDDLRAGGAEVDFVELAEEPTLAHWQRLLSAR